MANVPVITEPDWDGKTPYSRSEAILLSIINGTPIDTEKWEGIPLSRGEYLLLQLKDVIEDNSMLDFKGRVDSVNDLPSTGNKKGDVYSVGPESQLNRPEYFWTGTSWEYFGQIVDLSGYATLQEVSTAINAAVTSLTSMIEYTYLPLTGGVIRDSNQVSDSGKVYFQADGTRTGFIGKSTSNDLTLETLGKSLSLTNTGNSFDIVSKAGPLNIGTENTNAPISIKSYGAEIMKVTSPNEYSMTTHGENNTTATKFEHKAGDILMAATGEISIATPKSISLEKGDNTGAWLVIDNETNPKVMIGVGSPNSIVAESGKTTINTPLYLSNVYANGTVLPFYAYDYSTQTYVTRFTVTPGGIQVYGSSILGTSATLNNNPLRATVLLTQAEYDALTTKDPNVVYNIYEPDEEEGE